jgi:hypothetical protein
MLVNTAGPFAAPITSTFNIEHTALARENTGGCHGFYQDPFGDQL